MKNTSREAYSWKHYLLIVSLWFLSLFIIAWVGLQIIPHTDVNSTFGYPQRWSNWDGNNYVHIAMQGYEKTGTFSYAFFPFYPLLIHVFGYVIPSFYTAAWIIAIVSFVGAVLLLRKLLRLEYTEPVVRDTILFLLLFPTSFFFFATYTESLFLLLVLSSIYRYRKGNFWVSFGTAALATATRTNGVGLVIFFLVELFLQKKRTWKHFIPLAGPFLGLGSYMTYLWFTKGDPLYFHTIQQTEFFRSGIVLPIQPLISLPLKWMRNGTDIFSVWLVGITFAEIIGSYLFFGLILVGYFQRIRLSYLGFALFCWSLPLSTGITASMLRFFIILFPCFLTLSLLFQNRPVLRTVLFVIFAIGLVLAVMYFHTGHWIA